MQEPDVDVHHADDVCFSMDSRSPSVRVMSDESVVRGPWSGRGGRPWTAWSVAVALCAKRVSWWVTKNCCVTN